MLELAFPDDQDLPAPAAQPADMLPVVRHVPGKFVRPELPVALGGGGALAALVPVPEAAMHEHHRAMPGQHDIRLAGEVRSLEPEAVASAVQQAADLTLRAGILAPDLRHVPAALGLGKGVRHGPRIDKRWRFNN